MVVRQASKKPSSASKARRVTRRARRKASREAVLIVNMIPQSLSGETNQDSEPSITVNPANPRQIAASAFTPNPAGGDRAPIFISVDGGQTWALNAIVPSSAGWGSVTADITVAFGSASGVLYSGILRYPPHDPESTRLNILRTKNFQSMDLMTVLVDREGSGGVDQPFVRAVTVGVGPDKGKDRVYVGDNDLNRTDGRTATIEQSLNAAGSPSRFSKVRLESRDTPGQDGPTVRPAVHPDGTVYAALHSWRTYDESTGFGTADIVVVRDDEGGVRTARFKSLLDPVDGKPGVRVVQGSHFQFDQGLGPQRIWLPEGRFRQGEQRLGGDVAIAVDPTNSSRVYLAWADNQGDLYSLHVRRSTDRGLTWSSSDLRTIPNAVNPTLAINDSGRVAFLYQQLRGAGASQRWVTRLELATSASGANWRTLVMATTPASTPRWDGDPYLGDYAALVAVGRRFYGVFSASNVPDRTNFPNGVRYQRNADFKKHHLLDIDNTTVIAPSIDPFFFRIGG
jgi:hypothetical protein